MGTNERTNGKLNSRSRILSLPPHMLEQTHVDTFQDVLLWNAAVKEECNPIFNTMQKIGLHDFAALHNAIQLYLPCYRACFPHLPRVQYCLPINILITQYCKYIIRTRSLIINRGPFCLQQPISLFTCSEWVWSAAPLLLPAVIARHQWCLHPLLSCFVLTGHF